jgi:serine/threonine protein phosphatase PrpC
MIVRPDSCNFGAAVEDPGMVDEGMKSMASNASDPRPPQPSGLQSMLARLRGMVQALKSPDPEEQQAQELLPTWDNADLGNAGHLPVQPISAALMDGTSESGPEHPSAEEPPASQGEVSSLAGEPPASTSATREASDAPIPDQGTTAAPALDRSSVPDPGVQLCPHCQAPRLGSQIYCAECGWIFPPPSAAAAQPVATVSAPPLKGRYQLGRRLGEYGDLVRYRGLDTGLDGTQAVSILILQTPHRQPVEAGSEQEPGALPEEPGTTNGERDAAPVTATAAEAPVWPSLGWELALLEKTNNPNLPRLFDHFVEDGFEYLVEEVPVGQSLWDAWDDPATSAEQRFTWLGQVAQTLQDLHEHGAMLEGLRPDIVVVSPEGQARLTDLADLLPLPLPPNARIRATYYSAPELILASADADARADLYSFGAMLYALHIGRELTDLDFEMQGVPKSFIQRFPDSHPLFARLVSKTFCRDVAGRFPTEDAAKEDPTGFGELIRTLDICRRTLDHVRLEIAAWTTTGMVRTGNEDAFALLHAVESRENRLGDSALVLLADGMGGSEAGEVAATLAIQTMRKFLVQQRAFAHLAGEAGLHIDDAHPTSDEATLPAIETNKLLLAAALREANQAVYNAARSNAARRGMGCTAEAVYVDGRHVLVGHVGDSRTYHLHRGRMVQITTDQTWVTRMVEIGMLTPEEAEEHPRRNELQQAIGGHPDIEPAAYHSPLAPGDWVVVCSDGLSNHISAGPLKEMLQSSHSAESAARRLINMVNFAGATDNATVVVVRAT